MTIRKGNKDPIAWYGSGQDITENHLKAQTQIQLQKEKAQALRQLVMGIAEQMESPLHELHTAENYLRNDRPNITVEERKRDINFFFQAEDGIRGGRVTGVQTCALPISQRRPHAGARTAAHPSDRR